MRVAVTGATGFIGGHVLRVLEDRGIESVAVTHHRPPQSGMRASRMVDLDIAHPRPDSFTELGRPDAVIHLAWGGLPAYGSRRHTETELPIQVDFLTSLVQSGLSRLVVAGTCMEYGLQDGALSEDRLPAPANAYASAKDQLRRSLEQLRSQGGFHLTWTRVFYVYGPGQAATSLYGQLAAAHDQHRGWLDISGDEQERDFLPVEEASDILVQLTLSGADHGIVNVCSGVPTSVRSMAERIIHDNGWAVRLQVGARPPSPHEPTSFWGDRTKLDRILGHGARQ